MAVSIKAWFGDWHSCDEEYAFQFCEDLRKRSLCGYDTFVKAVNARHLKGVTYEELYRRYAGKQKSLE